MATFNNNKDAIDECEEGVSGGTKTSVVHYALGLVEGPSFQMVQAVLFIVATFTGSGGGGKA